MHCHSRFPFNQLTVRLGDRMGLRGRKEEGMWKDTRFWPNVVPKKRGKELGETLGDEGRKRRRREEKGVQRPKIVWQREKGREERGLERGDGKTQKLRIDWRKKKKRPAAPKYVTLFLSQGKKCSSHCSPSCLLAVFWRCSEDKAGDERAKRTERSTKQGKSRVREGLQGGGERLERS